MVLRMTRPAKRPDSTFLTFRKRVPADLQQKARGRAVTFQFPEAGEANPAVAVTVTMGDFVKVSLRTREPSVAKALAGMAEAAHSQAGRGPLRRTLYKTFADPPF